MQYKIIKNTTSGNVQIVSASKPERFVSIAGAADIVMNPDKTGFSIISQSGAKDFVYSDIVAYKIGSAAEISTSGVPLVDFLKILSNSFFFELSAGQLPSSIVRTGEVTVNIAASANNLVIPNINRVSIIRLNAAVPLVVTGFVAPSPVLQQEFLILNIGAQVQLTRESLLSTAGNRFAGVNATETIVATNGSRRMIYEVSINRFKILQ